MNLEFYNCPKSGSMEDVKLPETPEFIKYVPDFNLISQLAKEYENYKNILIIGHGGSVSSFYGMYFVLKYQANKNAYFLNTVDPDYIYELKNILKPANTLVIAISKSGETITQIEALSQFLEFPILIITGKASPLREIGERLGYKIIIHPAIGGRYTAMTEVGLIPAAIAGLDIEGIFKGAQGFYYLFEKENLAWKAASVMWQLEQKGFVDVFMPFYSHNLFYLNNLIVQLCHESFCKNEKGQTYLSAEAPESQHHTNQRFFGGQKNICGFFLSCDSVINNKDVVYPPNIYSVQIKNYALFDANKIPLDKSLNFELIGTLEDARINSIPVTHLSIASYSSQEIGLLVAFWQLYAVYSSILRQVDPFNQPQVENSKKISFSKRLAFKGLL